MTAKTDVPAGIAVATQLLAGALKGHPMHLVNNGPLATNHAEGIVVETAIVAGPTPQSKRFAILKST